VFPILKSLWKKARNIREEKKSFNLRETIENVKNEHIDLMSLMGMIILKRKRDNQRMELNPMIISKLY
jgi:hypothetical protein